MATLMPIFLIPKAHVSFAWTPTEKMTIDYKCEDGRFPLSASCVTILNPDSLSSSETGVNFELTS
jgi:hypothetical protein